MKLNIRYNDSIHRPAAAAFVRGAEAGDWLKEISRWNLPVDDLQCYIIPVSLQSPAPAGLFVIFKNASVTRQLDVLELYTCIADKLYIPVNAELSPQVSKQELKKLLLWDQQVFHPGIGFIGFEQKDRVHLPDLFSYHQPVAGDWSFAHPGTATRPAFEQILVVPPTAEELMDSIKDEIGQKPLNEIPVKPEDETTALGRILDSVKFVFFGGILSAATILNKIIPAGAENASNASNRSGIFKRLQDWLEKNMEEIQRKRNDEIQRLLKLFDENNNEALQYAIPLDSPYLKRGESKTSSTKLTRNPFRFNLGGLGGGETVDSWDLGDYYHDLRAKYLKSAEKEIANKDFKKAAYIYAHLLGDYHSAANVLEQGGLYREAAALYKDHLKNNLSAAECLERGGLYIEAIELYKDLNKNEKIGDLYRNLHQQDNAEQYYEKYIDGRLLASDNMDAARVINEKLGQTGRAKETLLEGWKGVNQAEPCLKTYFDIVLHTEPDTTEKEVKEIYAKHTPAHKKLSFLNILEYVNKKTKEEAFTNTTQDIAYEIIHGETEKGNVQVLNNLKRFLPDDKLLGSDTSRYTASYQGPSYSSATPEIFYLDQSIKWIKATWHRNQFLVLGIKNGLLYMARGNWYANMEYYSWDNLVQPYTRFTFINAPYHSNTILLHASEGLPATRKNLQKNKYFNEALIVYCPIWMHKVPAQCAINEAANICRLDSANGSMTIHQYTMDGDLKKSINCIFDDGFEPGQVASSPQLVVHGGYYYTYKNRDFITISGMGSAKAFNLKTIIRFFVVSQLFGGFYLVISTNAGCYLCKPANLSLNIVGNMFAQDLIPSVISFIASDRFVIVEKKRAVLFEIINDTTREIKDYQTYSTIIAVLPTSFRNKFALIEESGRVTMCAV